MWPFAIVNNRQCTKVKVSVLDFHHLEVENFQNLVVSSLSKNISLVNKNCHADLIGSFYVILLTDR